MKKNTIEKWVGGSFDSKPRPRPMKVIGYEFSHLGFSYLTWRTMCSGEVLKFRPRFGFDGCDYQLPKEDRHIINIRLSDLIEYQDYCHFFSYEIVWKKYFNRFKKDLYVDNISDLKKVILKVVKTYIQEDPYESKDLRVRNTPKDKPKYGITWWRGKKSKYLKQGQDKDW